jgi:hypothetical protein
VSIGQWLSRKQLSSQVAVGVSLLILLIAQIWAAMILVRHGLNALAFPYPLDYGEGPLLDQAVRLANFKNIYWADLTTPPYVVANYPPLFELAQAPFVWLFGPAFWYGRVISLISAVAVAILIALTLHALTENKIGAAAGGLTFLAVPYVLTWSSLARVDMLGLALSWAGLFVVAHWPESRRLIILAAMLLLAAVYTRQTYALAAPFAAVVWLLVQSPRRRALELAGVVWGLALMLLLILSVLTDGGFFLNTVIFNMNEFHWERWSFSFSEVQRLMPYLLLSGGAFLLLAPWWQAKSYWLVAPYAAGAVLSAVLIGKVGSASNYLLELSAALSLTVGALVAWQGRHRWLQAAIILALAIQIFWMIRWSETYHTGDAADYVAQRSEIERLNEIVWEAEGTVLADRYIGLLPLNGRRIYFQPFELTQLAREGKWDQRPFLRALDEGEFATILIWQPPYAYEVLNSRWTPEMLDRINERYEPAEEVAGTVVYRPR